ncbi:MAG: radical SAM protein [archaeon]
MKIVLFSTSTFPADQGLRTLSACLKRAGHKVNLVFLPLSEDYTEIYSDSVLKQIEDKFKDYNLAGITAMASTTKRAEQLIKIFVKHDIPAVWGGPHPTFFPEDCIKYCDIICRGEGEEAFVDLAEKLENKEDITHVKNFWVRKGDEIIKNGVRAAPENLDILAHPDYNLEDQFILESGKLIQFQEKHLAGMIFFQTGRGCPQACTYCTNHIIRELYKGKNRKIFRTHSVDYVIKELVRLKEKFPSIGFFDIRDESFLIRSTEWIKEFCGRYKAEVGIRFKCLAEPASGSLESAKEKLQVMVDAGLTDIIIGIQSGSDRLNRDVYKRHLKSAQVQKCAENINLFKDKLTVMYDIIATNPYEEWEDVLATINVILKLPKPFFLSVNNLIFFEGTPLHEKAIRDGFVTAEGKDPSSELNYWDRWQHIRRKNKNAYLDLVLNMMRGTANKKKYGIIPAKLMPILLNDKMIKFNLKHKGPTFFVGYNIWAKDYVRETVAKPLYRKMPTGFKLWYDKMRYKG